MISFENKFRGEEYKKLPPKILILPLNDINLGGERKSMMRSNNLGLVIVERDVITVVVLYILIIANLKA